MARIRRRISLDERVSRAVDARAARTGQSPSDVIEPTLRRDLGFETLDRIWADANLGAKEALELAVEPQHEARLR